MSYVCCIYYLLHIAYNKIPAVTKLENYIDTKWLVPIDKKYMMVYPITHEFGHVIENEIIDKLNVSKTFGELKTIDSQIKDEILSNVMKRTDLSKLEIKQLYFSDYANSEPYREWFAESFTQLELGKKNIWIEEFEKWLKEHY